MLTFGGIMEAVGAVRAWYYRESDKLPAHVREAIGRRVDDGSTVPLVVAAAESIYANRDALDEGAKEIGGALAAFADDMGFAGRLDNRAASIAKALRRDAGVKAPGGGWPKKSSDPAPAAEYEAPAA